LSIGLKKKLKGSLNEVRNDNAKVQIGKNGLTPAVFKAINDQLDMHQLIKAKFLTNYLTEDLDGDIKKIAKETKSQLVEKRGKTIILYKPKNLDS